MLADLAESDDRSLRERIRIGASPIAPVARITTLASYSTVCPPAVALTM